MALPRVYDIREQFGNAQRLLTSGSYTPSGLILFPGEPHPNGCDSADCPKAWEVASSTGGAEALNCTRYYVVSSFFEPDQGPLEIRVLGGEVWHVFMRNRIRVLDLHGMLLLTFFLVYSSSPSDSA